MKSFATSSSLRRRLFLQTQPPQRIKAADERLNLRSRFYSQSHSLFSFVFFLSSASSCRANYLLALFRGVSVQPSSPHFFSRFNCRLKRFSPHPFLFPPPQYDLFLSRPLCPGCRPLAITPLTPSPKEPPGRLHRYFHEAASFRLTLSSPPRF